MPNRTLPLALCLLLHAAPAEAGDLEAAHALARSSDPDELLRAAALYESWLESHPGNFEAQLGAARALNAVMAIQTHANLPKIDGLQDTPANRALWAELGKRSLAHARAAADQEPESPDAAAQLANAYMYYASSLGIIRAILEGSAGEYETHAMRLVALDEGFDHGLGHFLLAGFYLVAPWPVGDLDKARTGFSRAAELAPEAVRNQYGLGVFWAREDDRSRARIHFERAVSQPCAPGAERHFCAWMKAESQRALAALTEG